MASDNQKNIMFDSRPILIIANSSWYLCHYRSLLIKEISLKNKIISIAPIDKSSKELSKNSIFIPWRIHRSNDLNFFSLFLSFIKMLLLIRAIKPKLIHSHTMKTNLLASIVSSVYDIPCIFSFAGLGSLSRSKGIKIIYFQFVLKIISFFATRKRISRWSWSLKPYKTFLIFQNPIDKNIFQRIVKNFDKNNIKLIEGSGVPLKYLEKKNSLKNNKWIINKLDDNISTDSITFIYCGRLIKSKGINIFLEIIEYFPYSKGIIFGDIDPSSKDSLDIIDIEKIKLKHKNISFEGNIKDPLIALRDNFPILIVPSEYGEGLSRTILEAFSLKIPIICSKMALSGIFNSKQLLFSESNSPKEYYFLINKIINQYKNKTLQKKLEFSFRYISNNFSEKQIVNRTINLYEVLLANNNSSYLINKKNSSDSFWLAQ